MNSEIFRQRRQRLLDHIGDGIAILVAAPERPRNRDILHPYRFDSDFWYLSGFPEPEAALVLVGGKTPRSILFCRDKDEEREIWDGFRHGPAAACERFGFDEAFSFTGFADALPELIAGRETLWCAIGQESGLDAQIIAARNRVRAQSRAGKRAPAVLHDIREFLQGERLIKDAHEIDIMRRAARITSDAHTRAMRACRPGQMEYALEAELSHEFRSHGASGHAYPPIVAGGANACILHYVNNDRPLVDGTLVLIDVGCELDGYAADITRTFPVNGRFSGIQREVYEIVLAAQAAAFAAIRPGAPFSAYHDAALRILTQGMVDLKLLAGTVDGLIESEAYKPFYMHRTGHWLGLDVHDVGEYKTAEGDGENGESEAWTTLRPGMALTVEPGLYLRAAANVPEHLHGIGIRIEDDVFVTETGCEVYTTTPRTVADIEAVMRDRGNG